MDLNTLETFQCRAQPVKVRKEEEEDVVYTVDIYSVAPGDEAIGLMVTACAEV